MFSYVKSGYGKMTNVPHALGHVWNKQSCHETMQNLLTAFSKLITDFRKSIVQVIEAKMFVF